MARKAIYDSAALQTGADANYSTASDAYDGSPVKITPSLGLLKQGARPKRQQPAQYMNWLLNQIAQVSLGLIDHTAELDAADVVNAANIATVAANLAANAAQDAADSASIRASLAAGDNWSLAQNTSTLASLTTLWNRYNIIEPQVLNSMPLRDLRYNRLDNTWNPGAAYAAYTDIGGGIGYGLECTFPLCLANDKIFVDLTIAMTCADPCAVRVMVTDGGTDIDIGEVLSWGAPGNAWENERHGSRSFLYEVVNPGVVSIRTQAKSGAGLGAYPYLYGRNNNGGGAAGPNGQACSIMARQHHVVNASAAT